MPKKTLVKVFAVLAVLAIAFASFTSLGGDDTVSGSAAGLPAVTGNAGEAPTITPPTGAAPTTLQTQDIIVGTGTEILPTSTLTVHYTLMTWSNGALVESSWSRRLLVIPADKGYGPNGSGPIGPNETLIFVVDIIAVS